MKLYKNILLSVAALLVLAALPLSAAAGVVEDAQTQIKQGKYTEAIVALQGYLLGRKTGQAPAQFWLGVAYNRIMDYDRAAAAFVAARSAGFNHPAFFKEAGLNLWGRGKKVMALVQLRKAPADDPEAAYYHGLAAASLGKRKEANDAFRVAAKDPTYAPKVAAYLEAAGLGPRAKSWGGAVHIGFEYNDDVAQVPSSASIPSDQKSRDDIAILYTLRGWWTFYQKDNLSMGVGANIGGSQYMDLGNYSFQNGGVNLYVKKIMDPFQFRVNGGFTHSRIDGDGNANAFYLSPGMSWQPLPITWTDFDVRFSTTDYLHDDRTNQVTDGGTLNGMLMNSSVTLSQSLKLADLVGKGLATYFRLTTGYLSNQAGGQDSESSGYRLGVMASQSLPAGFRITLDVSYRRLDYDRDSYPNHPTNGKRGDDTWIFGARASWQILRNLSVYLGWRYVENDSNIPIFYSYDGNTITTGMVFTF